MSLTGVRMVIIIVVIAALNGFSHAGKLYKWIDRGGNMHFTDSPANIPDEYADQVDIDDIKGTKGNKEEVPRNEPADDNNMPVTDERESSKSVSEKSFEVPYEAFEGRADRIIVTALINGSVNAKLVIDTGSPGMIISYELARRLELMTGSEGNLMIMTAGIGGAVPAVRTIIDSVNIGGAEDIFIPATITDSLSNAWEGLVGMDFLKRYTISIDTEKNIITFRSKDSSLTEPGGHDERWWRDRFKEFANYKNAWADYLTYLKNRDVRGITSLSEKEDAEDIIWFAEEQIEEANKLYFKLNSYATDNMVPMHWREY